MAGEKTSGADSKEELQLLTEEDLLKSLKETAGKTEPTQPPKKSVQLLKLSKSFTDTLKEKASPQMTQALEMSGFLREFADHIGEHVDQSLQEMAKSLNGSTERDLATVEALVELKKSIDANTEAVKRLGETPMTPAGQQPITVDKNQLLQKSLGQDGQVDSNKVRANVRAGLEALAKSLPPGNNQQQRWSRALITFESTGQINPQDLAAAQAAYLNPPAPAAAA